MKGAPLFTPAAIGVWLDLSPRTVKRRLEREARRARGIVYVNSKKADGWPVAAFPSDWRDELAAAARRESCRDIDHLLSSEAKLFQPEIPLGEVAQRHIDDAMRRREALAPLLRDFGDAPLSDLVRQARAAFARVSGYKHRDDRTVRRWLEAARKNDRNRQDFNRLEIWLDEKLSRKTPEKCEPQGAEAEILGSRIGELVKPSEPTSDDRHSVWVGAMIELDERVATGQSERLARKAVFEALNRSGVPLAKSGQALYKRLKEKRTLWLAGGRKPSAIKDRRPEHSGNHAPPLPEEDRLTLVASCVEHGGRFSEGFREVVEAGKFSDETAQRFIVNPASNSHVPRRIRKLVTNDVRGVLDHHHGPRQAKLNGAYIDRDWSDVEAGDWWQGDDLTSPVIYWENTPEGLFVGRGQLILMIDVRSLFPLGWFLHSDAGYLARSLRSLWTKCHDVHGLPRRGCYYENGMWKNARLLKGRNGDLPLSMMENGLREFCEFRHAQLPRAKPIERVLGLAQDKMEKLPGYVGRNERNDRYERVQRQLLDVKAQRCNPPKYFLEKRELMAVYQEIFEGFANRPQGGKMLPGISPRELYEQRRVDDVVQLGNEHRYLLANHRMPVKVTKNGIRLPPSMGGGVYRDGQTGSLIGQTVLCWVDVDNLDCISLTDLKMRNPIVVGQAAPLPAMDATAEEIERAMMQRDAHNHYHKTLYRTIRPRLQSASFRPVVSDPQSSALGKEIAEKTDALRERREKTDRKRRVVADKSRRAGVQLPVTDDPTRLDAQSRLADLLAKPATE